VYRVIVDYGDNDGEAIEWSGTDVHIALETADAHIAVEADELRDTGTDPYIFSHQRAQELLDRNGVLTLSCPDGRTIIVEADEIAKSGTQSPALHDEDDEEWPTMG
jgi:hypothetical protein